ncbi:MAG: hypothetical protein LBH51_02905 [Treponema sp.]|jgi:hypothetical protein|nr:hypothetical protein [Treponema sp.]
MDPIKGPAKVLPSPKALSFFILFLGIALTAAGIVLGDGESVFKKAVFICLECMGIG